MQSNAVLEGKIEIDEGKNFLGLYFKLWIFTSYMDLLSNDLAFLELDVLLRTSIFHQKLRKQYP